MCFINSSSTWMNRIPCCYKIYKPNVYISKLIKTLQRSLSCSDEVVLAEETLAAALVLPLDFLLS